MKGEIKMTNEEAREQIENLREHCSNMLRSTFTDGEDIWGKDLEALDLAIKALAKHDYFIETINRESYIRGYNKAMSIILQAYNISEYPEYTEDDIYQELNKWQKEGVPNEQ